MCQRTAPKKVWEIGRVPKLSPVVEVKLISGPKILSIANLLLLFFFAYLLVLYISRNILAHHGNAGDKACADFYSS